MFEQREPQTIAQTLSSTVGDFCIAQSLSPAARALQMFLHWWSWGSALRFTPGFMLSPAPQATRAFRLPSMRSFRAEHVSLLGKQLLDLEKREAGETLAKVS